MRTFIAFIDMQRAFWAGEVDYTEYARFVRRKDQVVLQSLFLLGFLLIMVLVYDVPLIMILWMVVVGGYGLLMQKDVDTVGQQFRRALVWGITSFLASAAMLFIGVGLGWL